MSLQNDFISFIKKNHLFEQKDRLMIAVSGGVDSVVLCELCYVSGFDFIMAHCDFGLREEESRIDAIFVRELGNKYGVEVKMIEFETLKYAEEKKVNIQIAARELRYNWFNEIIETEKEKRIQHILTAHHADDNIETVLMNFIKGTSINGLQGIQPKDAGIGGKVTRPLLFARKAQLTEFAKEHQLQWREDSSNESSKYTRNFLRNEWLPSIRKIFSQVDDNMLHNINRLKDVKALYDVAIGNIIPKLLMKEGSNTCIPVLKLLKQPAVKSILFELFTPYGFSVGQIDEIEKLCHAESGKYILSDTHRVLKNRNWLILSEKTTANNVIVILNEHDTEAVFNNKKIVISTTVVPDKLNSIDTIALLDADEIKYPLLLRKWKQGDYFYPLGMSKKKKLSRFFIDKKLSINEKENVWVLESNKKIVWVVGLRIDDRYKITPATSKVLKLSIAK